MNIVSLFAGCGGFDLGFKKAGFDIIWANEFDKTIHETYRYNHPDTILNTSDIRTLDISEIPDCDGIIGGPPCQSWSVGGKSLGLEDERGRLVYNYINIVSKKRPKFFIMENVPGMISPRHIKAFNDFISLFEKAGYIVKYKLINAADFCIPQERLRVFIVGIRNDINSEYFFPIPKSERSVTLFQAIGDLKTLPISYNTDNLVNRNNCIPNHDYYCGEFDKKFMARNRVRTWSELSFTIQAQAKNAPLHPQAPKMIYLNSTQRIFAPGHEKKYRRLSIRECARIQSFPDSFFFLYNTIIDGYKMVGNAVPPRLAYHLALSIKDCLKKSESNNSTSLILLGYVKSEKDFEIIEREQVYYIRRGTRYGSLQFGQLSKPVKWLLLHRDKRRELFELEQSRVEKCDNETLEKYGFKPKGNEYWLFRIKKRLLNNSSLNTFVNEIKELHKFPQIIHFYFH